MAFQNRPYMLKTPRRELADRFSLILKNIISDRNLVTKLGQKLNIRISPHDLRRHSATYASRNGVPLEIISKVILRHKDLKTTQIYLGKISDTEATRWMDVLQ